MNVISPPASDSSESSGGSRNGVPRALPLPGFNVVLGIASGGNPVFIKGYGVTAGVDVITV